MSDTDTTDPEPLLTPLELVARYQQAVPELSLRCIEAVRDIDQMLENVPDVRMRQALKQQQLVWQVQTHTLGMLMTTLQLLADVHASVGCNVTRQ